MDRRTLAERVFVSWRGRRMLPIRCFPRASIEPAGVLDRVKLTAILWLSG
ncbi:MAG: hypothetical protein U9Q76_01660 [candidate division WOR-3 bacterium]|nr:hypothetical protein [candidate division WOR-3 bacterium]